MRAAPALALCLVLAAWSATPSAPPERPQPGPDCVECPHWEAPASLTDRMTIAAPSEPGTRLVIEGTIFQTDGKTPTAGVLLYAYHTNAQGYYAHAPGTTGQGRWHGDLRGWLRTGPGGRYRIETIRPAPYPERSIPAHIHMHVMAPQGRERWIDDIVFDDDPLVTASYRSRMENLGGSGIVHLECDASGVFHGRRDIILPAE
jgi:protocatechuate 3,4-dioxygenase beta subunit